MPQAGSIKSIAERSGFELVGICNPDQPLHYSTFIHWLKAGRHGEMSYLDTERSRNYRGNPRQVLANCQAIVMLGVGYSANVFTREGLYGRISSYAGGLDYHFQIGKMLKKMVGLCEEHLGKPINCRWYTDTGPVLERDIAQRAGLGWIGKNTCLINPRRGSYLFLAEIFLDIELTSDAPFYTDRCGTCTRCIEACPTSCILSDRTLDAKKCISYLTIELKGPIPDILRPLIGGWVFGCDVCQQVCPWNQRFAHQQENIVSSSDANLRSPDLIAELSVTPEAFQKKFQYSAMKRAKRSGYLRNVAVALANRAILYPLNIPSAVSALTNALLNDPEPLVRGHSAWGLGKIGDHHSKQALRKAQRKETEPYVLGEIKAAL